MKILKFNPNQGKAQAILEFAIILPVLLLVVYGLIETGRLLFIVSSVNNATRQAARYGSTSGVGPNGVPRYQDCNGIRDAAERSDFLNAFNAFDTTNFVIEYDRPTASNPDPAPYDTCTGSVDTGVTATTGDRITVRINARYDAIIPRLVPFISRAINTESSRTLLLTISIKPPKEDTTTIITADTPDPSEIGQPVTVSVSVTAKTTPTGTVSITGADSNCSITLSNGSGSCVVIFTSIGARTLTASYAGDDKHNPSSDTENHTVDRASTTTEITADTPEPSLVGGTVTVAVEVTSTWGIPGGTVSITGADTNCTITLSGGSGNCNVNFTSIGAKTLTASYNGDATYKTSTDTESHDVISPNATITTIMSDSPDPSAIGQSVTVAVAVTGSTTPTGTVTITGADTNCTITLSGGTGSCTVIFNSIGNKTLTATYGGSPDHTASSATESHTVQLRPTVTTITADAPDPSSTGQTVNVAVSVTSSSTTPTGTVTITGGDANCTISLFAGTGNCNVAFSTAGSKTLIALYGGDGIHATSNASETHTVTTPPVPGCNTTNVTVGLLRQSGGALVMNINNTLAQPLRIRDVTVSWNHDKGHQTGSDKSLILQSATLAGVTFWTGSQNGPTYTIIPPAATDIPASTTSTISFIFHQTFDNWKSESVTINLSTPGCEGVILFQNQH